MIFERLSMSYGSKKLFENVSLTLRDKARYGIVGANGAGKSTLMRILTGNETHFSGKVIIPHKARIGFLKQDQYLYDNELILEVVLQGKKKLWSALQEKERLKKSKPMTHEIGYKLAELEEIIAHEDGYSAEAMAEKLLRGLGIEEKYIYEPLKVLSGGMKLRVLLAQVLFDDPDILLLDEPTNYLDISTIYWLENYLKNNFRGLLFFISHDQDFLNNVATHILDIDFQEITEYTGNYDKFLIQKELMLEQKARERVTLERQIAQWQAFVNRFKAKASKARQAQSKQKMIDRIELPEIKESSYATPSFFFIQKRPCGKVALTIKKLNKSFENKKVLNNITFHIERGEKVALVGPNGIGKSTLIKILVKELTADSGTINWGYEATYSYFAQENEYLRSYPGTLYEWLYDAAATTPSNVLRSTLGHMLFSQDDIHKKVANLSGGELARLVSAKMMLEHANILLLDEPTNHFDLAARASLAEALEEFEGTVLFVSHDRHFVSRVATRVIAITHDGIKDMHGSYDEFLNHGGRDYLYRKM